MRTNTNDIIVKTLIEHAHKLRRASGGSTAKDFSKIINELENNDDFTQLYTEQLLALIRYAEISLHQDKQIKKLQEEIVQIERECR